MKYKIVKEFIGNLGDFGKRIKETFPIMFQTHVIAKDLSFSEAQKIFKKLDGKFEHHKIYIINECDLLTLPEKLITDEYYCDIMNN